MKKIVIVLGATGKVGCYSALHLKEVGFDVIAVGHRDSDNGFFSDHGIKYVSMDIMDVGTYEKLPKSNVYAIVHFAATLPATMEGYHPRVFVESNIYGTMNVLDYAVKVGIERFVFARTVADVYYLYDSKKPIPADAPSRFPLNTDHSIYAITKNAACDIVAHYAAKYNFKYYIFRFANVFCYHPNPTFYKDGQKRWTGQRAIIEQARQGEDIELWGNPECKRDVFYVKDCTQIVEKMLTGNGESGTYNIGNNMPVTRMEQIQGIIDVFGRKDKPSRIIVNAEKPNSPDFALDISKTIEQLGYEPKYDYISFLKDLKHEMEINRFEKLWGKESDYTEGLI